jgi:transcription antitermination factor NusG
VTEGQRSFAMKEENIYWYAVHTLPRWEKKVASLLQDKGINNYCPLNKIMRQWSDRKKTVLEPLFKGYVFVQVAEALKWEILTTNGIVNYVHWLGKPAKIQDNEIDTIRRFLHEFKDVEVSETGVQVKNKVQVKQGILMNYKGIVLELQGNKAKVKIESMGIQLSALFDLKNLEVVSSL